MDGEDVVDVEEPVIDRESLVPPMNSDSIYQQPCPQAVRRLIVIDGCNVARASCGPSRETVDCVGLLTMVRFLLMRDFDCVTFIPITYNNAFNSNVSHSFILQKMQMLGLLTFTSARTGNGHRRAFLNYDDLYVLEFAYRHGGCVLSGDRFTDILNQHSYREFHSVIMERRMGVQFYLLDAEQQRDTTATGATSAKVASGGFFRIGSDRFYRTYLRFCLEDNEHVDDLYLRTCFFTVPQNPEYRQALYRRNNWSAERRFHLLQAIDSLMDIVRREKSYSLHNDRYLYNSENLQLAKADDADPVELLQIIAAQRFNSKYSMSSSDDGRSGVSLDDILTESDDNDVSKRRRSSGAALSTSSSTSVSSTTSSLPAPAISGSSGFRCHWQYSHSGPAPTSFASSRRPPLNYEDDSSEYERRGSDDTEKEDEMGDNKAEERALGDDSSLVNWPLLSKHFDDAVAAAAASATRRAFRRELTQFLGCMAEDDDDDDTNGASESGAGGFKSELDGINFYETPEQTAIRWRNEQILELFNCNNQLSTITTSINNEWEEEDFSTLSQFQLTDDNLNHRDDIDRLLLTVEENEETTKRWIK